MCFMYNNGMSVVLLRSKKWKCLEWVGNYWKRQRAKFENQSDKGPDTDSQDSKDHGVWPEDENVQCYTKRKRHQ